MAKKTPIMLKRLKKKLKREDIQKYGTPEEIKLLEADDPFEIPVGDEQDQSLLEEEISLEDEQEAGISDKISVPVSLLEEIFEFLANSKESEQTSNLMTDLGDVLGYYNDEDEAIAKEDVEITDEEGYDEHDLY